MSGMDIRTLKEIFGHSSEVTTEIYITNLQDTVKREVMGKSPSISPAITSRSHA